MPIDTQHPEYLVAYPYWSRARAVLAGEEAVKRAGTKLLPQIDGHSSLEYDAYKKRANFFNATARTLNGYVGMVFRREPSTVLPEGLEPVAVFQTDTDLLGTPLRQYAREVFTLVLGVGRCGTLINWDEIEDRPHCVLYLAEDIVNWRVSRVRNRFRLTMLVLREWYDAGRNFEVDLRPQYRLLGLRSLPDGRTGVAASLIREVEKGRWNVVEDFVPLRSGEP